MRVKLNPNCFKQTRQNIEIAFEPELNEFERVNNFLIQNSDKISLITRANGKKITVTLVRKNIPHFLQDWILEFGEHDESVRQLKEAIRQSEIHFKGREFDFNVTERPVIYSILNLTPDSFYDGGVNASISAVLSRIDKEMALGASIFEVGGKSSKPHFEDISPQEEWGRVVPFLKEIHKSFPDIVLAIDSNTPEVMKLALENGIQIINDIDGFNSEDKLKLVAKYKPDVVTMFNGRNFNEQVSTLNKNMDDFFTHSINDLKKSGLSNENIVIDPGVGFSAKNAFDFDFDFIKMKYIQKMDKFAVPSMVAISRKSFAKHLFNLNDASQRLIPTLIFETFMTILGGRILRVHDVAETQELLTAFDIFKDQIN